MPGEDQLSPSQSGYSMNEVAEACRRFRERAAKLAREHPELVLVCDEFEDVVHHSADPLAELEQLLEANEQVLLQLKHLLNPTGLPLHMTKDGRVQTQRFDDVATFVTDIRGFSEMTQYISERWGVGVFDVLSMSYFPHLTEVLDRYECHYLNYTGDGLLVLVQGRAVENGQVVIPSLDNAALCGMEMIGVTNSIALAWQSFGLEQHDGTPHETGLGLTDGWVEVGDPLVPDREFSPQVAEFNKRFLAILAKHAPHFKPREDYGWRVRGIHALSPSINLASRLQNMDKTAPLHTIMMVGRDVDKLCPVLAEQFQPVGKRTLKGIGEAELFGILRWTPIDVPAIEKACIDYYRQKRST